MRRVLMPLGVWGVLAVFLATGCGSNEPPVPREKPDGGSVRPRPGEGGAKGKKAPPRLED
jgi:hypothetical protein